MPIHSSPRCTRMVRREGEAHGRMQVMDAALLQMARCEGHAGPSRYGRLQLHGNANYEVPGAEEKPLPLPIGRQANLTRPGDGLELSQAAARSVWKGWRPRGEAMHTVLWPRCPRAPPGPLPPGRRIASVSRCLACGGRSQALSGIKESEACRELWSHTWRSPVPWCGQRVHGPSGNARMHGESRPVPEHTPGPTGTREAKEPTSGSRLSYAPRHLEVPSDVQRLQRRVEQPGRLRALWCAMTLGKPLPRARGAHGPSSPVCSRLVPGLRRASPAPCAHDSWRQPCG